MAQDEARELASPEPAARTSSEPDWDALNRWLAAKLLREREFTRDVLGELLVQLNLIPQKKSAKRSISKRRAQARQRAR